MLMPGLVGLSVIDAFVAQVPMITTAVEYHSPEIEYLIPGINGILLSAKTTASEYADRVAELLNTPHELAELRRGCLEAAHKYTLDAMVDRFSDGVLHALQHESARGA